jgi:uncharacterized protein (TIGR02996 family)
MTPDDAFLQAIIASPDEDTPRLVYADWLDESGRPERAEFIRVQCALARMAVFNDRRRQLQRRQGELLGAHGARWLTQEWPQTASVAVNARTFERGWVAELSLRGRELGDAGARELASAPRLALLTALDLRDNGISGEGLRVLAGSPFLVGLASFDVRGNPLTLESLRALAASPHLAEVQELVVGPRGITVDEVQRWFRLHGKEVAVHTGLDYPEW